MSNPGAHLRVKNYRPTPAGRKDEARDKLLPELTSAHFKEMLQKLESKALDKKIKASIVAL